MYTIKNDAEMEIRHAQITNAEEARNPVCFRLPGHLTEIKKNPVLMTYIFSEKNSYSE